MKSASWYWHQWYQLPTSWMKSDKNHSHFRYTAITVHIVQSKPPMFGHHKISVIYQWVQPRNKIRLVNYKEEKGIQVVYQHNFIAIIIKEFRYYEVKIEESEKTCSRKESNPNCTCTAQVYWTPRSHTWQPLSMCRQTPLGVDQKISFIRKEPMLSVFISL